MGIAQFYGVWELRGRGTINLLTKIAPLYMEKDICIVAEDRESVKRGMEKEIEND